MSAPHAVKPRYFEVPRDMKKSSKWRAFEMSELAPNDGQTKGIRLDFEIAGTSNQPSFEIARFD